MPSFLDDFEATLQRVGAQADQLAEQVPRATEAVRGFGDGLRELDRLRADAVEIRADTERGASQVGALPLAGANDGGGGFTQGFVPAGGGRLQVVGTGGGGGAGSFIPQIPVDVRSGVQSAAAEAQAARQIGEEQLGQLERIERAVQRLARNQESLGSEERALESLPL